MAANGNAAHNQPYTAWEEEITQSIERDLDITRSDAQGIVMGQTFAMAQAWSMGLSAEAAAKRVIAAATPSSDDQRR